MSDKKREIEDNFRKMQELKKEKEIRMNPQLYIKKMYHTKRIELEKEMGEVIAVKKNEKSINPIINFYPSLNNSLKTKPIKNTGNMAIFSYTKNEENPEQSKLAIEQSQSVRLMEADSVGSYVVGKDDDE